MSFTKTIDPDGRESRTYYDGLGQVRFVKRGVGSAEETLTETLYDAAGRVTEVRPPLYFTPRAGESPNQSSLRTTYEYNTRGLLLKKQTPDAGVEQFKYDAMGRLRYSQHAQQATEGKVHFYVYDVLGRLDYEGVGRPVCSWASLSVTQPCNEIGTSVAFIYDGNNWIRMNHYDAPDSRSNDPSRLQGWPFYGDATFTYTFGQGRLLASAYKSNDVWQSVFYAYDAQGRTWRRWVNSQGMAYPWAKSTTTYDLAGHVLNVAEDVGPHTFQTSNTYDGLGDLQTTWSELYSNGYAEADGSFAYNPEGARSWEGHYDFQMAYSHDIRGQLRTIGNVDGTPQPYYADPFAARYTYTAGGLVTKGEFLSVYAVQGSPYDSYAKQPKWHYVYEYDGLGRLKSAEYLGTTPGTASTTPSYSVRGLTYDRNGNHLTLQRYAPRVSQSAALIDNLSYTYTSGTNRLASTADAANSPQWGGVLGDADPTGMIDYGWDGTVAYKEQASYRSNGYTYERYLETWPYDERGLLLDASLTEVTQTGQGVYDYGQQEMSYRYDGDGQRVYESVDGTVTRTTRDASGAPGAVLTGTGVLKYWNLPWGQGRLEPGGIAARIYVKDLVGSVRAVVEVIYQDVPTVREARDFDPWGVELPGRTYVLGSPATEHRFTGYEKDEPTQLLYAGARYYDASIGRFLSVDPMGQYASPYVYTGNNPVSLSDPTGLWANDCEGHGSFQRCYVVAEGGDTQGTLKAYYSLGQYGGSYASSLAYYVWGEFVHRGFVRDGVAIAGSRLSQSVVDSHRRQAVHEGALWEGLNIAGVVSGVNTIARAGFTAIRNGLTRLFAGGVVEGGSSIAGELPAFAKSTIDDVVRSAGRPRNQYIQEGARALEKKFGHAASGGFKSAFEGLAPNQDNANQVIRYILSNPTKVNVGNNVVDVYDAMGRGVRYGLQDRRFITFLEAALAPK